MRRELSLLAAAFLLSLPLVTPRIYASDEVQYFAYLRSLSMDGDVSFENEYRHFYDAGVTRYAGFHETFLERTTETGRRISFATLGAAVLWSPFYAAAHGLVRLGAFGPEVADDGYSWPYIAAVAYGSAVYGWLAVVLGWWMARRLGHARGALPAALAVWTGTPLLFYMYVAPPMSHGCSAFAVAAFLAVWLLVRERWSVAGCAALGALGALMAMVREQDLFVAAGPAADFVWTFARAGRQPAGRKRMLAGALAAGLAFVVCYLPQVVAYLALNGYPGPSRLVARKMTWTAPHALGVLASPRHGLLFWTPLALLALVGLVLALRRAPLPAPSDGHRTPAGRLSASGERTRVFAALLGVVALQVYIAGSVESWTVAGAFGQRRFVGLSAVLIAGLAAAWTLGAAERRRRWLMGGAAALCVWWNLGLMAQFGSGLMDRQRLELDRNAYHTFVTIPARLPEIAYRYLFERSTFYRHE